MRIFLLNTARGWGGLESHSIILAQALLALGHHVVLGCRQGGNVEQEAMARNIPITNITMRNAIDVMSLIKVIKFVKINHIEVVVANRGKEYWPATVAAKLAGVKIVLFRHQLDPVKGITRWLINSSVYKVIAVTQAVKQAMINSGVQADKVEVVHPGQNVECFRASAQYRSAVRAEYKISDDDIVIAAAGKLHPGKGIYELLEAVKQLSATQQHLKVMYIGDGEERHNLPARARELGMADQIIMTGYRADIDRLLSAIDIFALPSKGYESFGMVLIEAMAAGKPVIGTATGGIPEIITDSQNGLLVTPGSVDELGTAIQRLIEEPDFRQRLIAAGQQRVEESFTDTASASKVAAVLGQYNTKNEEDYHTMVRKIISLTLSVLLVASIAFAQPGAELTVVDKAAHVEKVIYGGEQTGSLLERVTKLEKEVYGTETQEALIAKVDRIYSYTKDNSGTAPSLITRVNAIEWTLTHSQTQDNIKARIDGIEKLLSGVPTAGSIDSRVAKLSKLAFGNHEIVTETVECAKDTLVKIKLTNAIDTKTTRVGDVVNFQASEDVYINDLLIIAKGAPGKGKVTKVEQAKNFGRDAKLEIDFESIQALDGTTIDMFLGKKAQEETKSLGKAAGATFVGLVVLGPVGIVGGAFVQGEDAKIPAGTLMFIQTKDAVSLYGMKVK